MKHYIGICANGYGAGKTTFAEYTVNFLRNLSRPSVTAEKFAFGDAVKDMLSAVTDITDKTAAPDGFCGKTVRELLQTLGTAWGRIAVGNDLWVNLLGRKCDASDANFVIVDDVRFPNELKFIKDRGGLMVYIHRDCAVKDESGSEGLIEMGDCDVIILNCGDLMQLEMNAFNFAQRRLFEREKAIKNG